MSGSEPIRLSAHLQAIGRNKIACWLLAVFLAFGPIYWRPGVSVEVLRRVEWSIFLVAPGLVFGPDLLKG